MQTTKDETNEKWFCARILLTNYKTKAHSMTKYESATILDAMILCTIDVYTECVIARCVNRGGETHFFAVAIFIFNYCVASFKCCLMDRTLSARRGWCTTATRISDCMSEGANFLEHVRATPFKETEHYRCWLVCTQHMCHHRMYECRAPQHILFHIRGRGCSVQWVSTPVNTINQT